MLNPRLAGRYAKSLIDLANEQNQLEPVYNDMLLLQSICKNSPEFVSILKSPVIPSDKKELIAKQAFDLALLSQGMLKGADLTKFVERSVSELAG